MVRTVLAGPGDPRVLGDEHMRAWADEGVRRQLLSTPSPAPGSRPPGGGQGLPAYPPSGWDTQEASHLCVWYSPPVDGGGSLQRKARPHPAPSEGLAAKGPPCSAPARAPQAPSPLLGGRRLSLPRPLSCMLAQTVPSPITGKGSCWTRPPPRPPLSRP